MPTVVFESWIIFLVLFNVLFLGTRVRRGEGVIIALAFAGVAMTIVDPRSSSLTVQTLDQWALVGAVAAVAAGLKASLNIRIARHFSDRGGAGQASLIPHFLTVQVALVLYMLALGVHVAIGGDMAVLGPFAWNADLLRIVVIGAGIMGIANPTFIHALAHRPTEAHSAVFYLIPILATFWLIQFGGAELTYFVALGGLLTIIAVMLLSVHSVRVDTMVGTGLTALVATYAMVTLNSLDQVPRITADNRFFVETAILIFSLVAVFGLERATVVRHTHDNAVARLVSELRKVWERAGRSDVDRAVLDEIGQEIAVVEYSRVRRVPMYYVERVVSKASRLAGGREAVREFEEAMYEWLDVRRRFYPRSHVMFIASFGLVCGIAMLFTTAAGEYNPVFSVFIISGIGYLVFYIAQTNNPSVQDATQVLHVFRVFEWIGRAPVLPRRVADRVWARKGHVQRFRVYEEPGDIGTAQGRPGPMSELLVSQPEPVFFRYISEGVFLLSLVISATWVIIEL